MMQSSDIEIVWIVC